MKRNRTPTAILLALFTSLTANAMATAEPAIIPRPLQMTVQSGSFTINLNQNSVIGYDAAFKNEANLLVSKLRTATATDFQTRLQHPQAPPLAGGISLTASGAQDLGPEGYTLDVTAQGVVIRAKTSAGIFYGTQTLLQLLPTQIFANHQVVGTTWSVPCVHIEDRPTLAWRGFMLDDSRHFFGKAEVEKMLDQMALLKLNVFHWHLTDDNGWRIEIKKYPKLTSIGAWRERDPKLDGPGAARYGGFYTQAEIREVVAYAAARHITIVPEIDIPGHSAAAMTAYPDLAPDNGWKSQISNINSNANEGVIAGTHALCVAKPLTVKFCENVLDEIMALFPSKDIHIGGDEVDAKQWTSCPIAQAAMKKQGFKDAADLQIHFQNELIAYLDSKGRHAIVWNNTYRTTLDKRAINQFWRWSPPMLHVAEFAKDGYKVLVSDKTIFYYDQNAALKRAYQYDPLASELPRALWSQEKGIEACVWSERLPDSVALERNVFPLIFVHAELGWTQPDRKDWASFTQRLPLAIQRCQLMGVSYSQKQLDAALKSVPSSPTASPSP